MLDVRFRVAIWLRREWRSLVLTALAVGIVGGMAMGLVAGTRRTASAPDRYTEWAGGEPDLLITQMAGPPLLDQVAQLDGVRSTKGFAFVLAFPLSPRDGTPLTELNPFAGDDDAVGARVVEGRFTDPMAANEFTMSAMLAARWREQFGTKVGDTFTFTGFSFEQLRSDLDLTKADPMVVPFTGKLVGITESPSDFDEASEQLIFSRGFFRDHADVGVVQTLIAATLEPGATGPQVLDEVRELPNGAESYASPLRIVSDSARRAVGFQTVALWLVSALVIAAACVVGGVVAGRALRVSDEERLALQALGWTRRDLAAERAAEGAAIGLAGVPVAAAVVLVATAAFPLGALEKFEPDSGVRADWLVVLLGALAMATLCALVGAAIGHHSRLPRVARPAVASLRGGSMPRAVGVHFATVTRRGNRGWAAAVVGALGIAGIVGAAAAGTSLTSIVGHGDRWGIEYDALYGNPYAAADRDIVGPILELPHVAAVTGGTIGSLTVNGSDVATFAFAPAKGDLRPTVIDGRNPEGDAEIALGGEVTRRLDLSIGDTVEVRGSDGSTRDLELVGKVLTPDSAGNGAALPFDSFAAMNPGASQNIVMVDMEPNAPSSALDAVSDSLYTPPDSLEIPSTIASLDRVAAAPFLLCVVFAIMLLVGGASLLGASVRGRRRDFAAFRSMGAVQPQRRSIVHWQATAIAAATTLIGVPVGILMSWQVINSIVTSMGIVPGVDLPIWLLAASLMVPVVVANLVAILPGWRATSSSIAALRTASG